MSNNFTNIVDAATDMLESLTDNHKTPLHVGEVMTSWAYLAFVSNIVSYAEIGLNTVTDPELKRFIESTLAVVKRHKKKMSEFMRTEGVSLPTMPEEKPESDPTAVPMGAKYTDDEIINTLLINFVYAANTCAAAASQCLRTDLASIFLKFQFDKLSLGFQARKMMQKKGWLKIPPYYHPPGSPESQ